MSEALPIKPIKHRKNDYVLFPGCKGICKSHQADFVKGSRYAAGQRYCSECECWFWKKDLKHRYTWPSLYQVNPSNKRPNAWHCPCCKRKTRTNSPHSKKEFKSDPGDMAFNYFNVAKVELKHACKTLPLYYACGKNMGTARVDAICKNIKLILIFLKDMKKYKRQRESRINDKYDDLVILVKKTIKTCRKYNSGLLSN